MDESVQRNDLRVRRLSLIELSSEDDSLIVNSSIGDSLSHPSSENQEDESFELLENANCNTLEDTTSALESREDVSQPSELQDQEMARKNGKYNLRKSLAWDSAFFTCAGVLEPEELSCIIEGVEKGEKHKLPGIQEEVHRSAESISTLESDGLTLESLEADLFEDVRASIQKSGRASNAANPRTKDRSGVAETQNTRSSKKVDVASQSKINPKAASIKPNVGLPGPVKTTKQVSVCPPVSQSIAARGGSISSLAKRPKAQVKDSPSSTALSKRASLGDNRVKMGNDNARSTRERGAPASKLPATGGIRHVPRPKVSSKSPSLGPSPAMRTKPTISSSFDSSGSASDYTSKSSISSVTSKTDSRTGHPPSSGSTSKTPSRTASRNKAQSGSSHLTANLMSASKLNSSTSPASSISDWSLESSSSSSALKQRPYSPRASLDITSGNGVSTESDAPHILDSQRHRNEQSSIKHGTQGVGLLGGRVKKASTAASALSHPSSMRPSGLRLPSPKIGFFDGAKSAGPTPPGSMPSHPGVPSGLPNSGARNVTPSGEGPNKANFGKLQPARTPTAIRSTKPDPQQASVNMKTKSPTPLQEPPCTAIRNSSSSRNFKSSPRTTPKVPKRLSRKSGGESQLKAEEIEAEGCDTVTSDSAVGVAEKNSSLDVLEDNFSSETKGSTHLADRKVTPINGGLKMSTPDSNITLCEKVGEDAVSVQPNFANDLHLINSTSKKENSKFEDQVDSMSRQVGAMDINKETQNKLIGDTLSLSGLTGNRKDDSSPLIFSCQRELQERSQQDEYLKSLSKPTPSFSPTTSEITYRTPFSVKDSFYNMDGLCDIATGLTVVEVEKTATLTSLGSSLKENS